MSVIITIPGAFNKYQCLVKQLAMLKMVQNTILPNNVKNLLVKVGLKNVPIIVDKSINPLTPCSNL